MKREPYLSDDFNKSMLLRVAKMKMLDVNGNIQLPTNNDVLRMYNSKFEEVVSFRNYWPREGQCRIENGLIKEIDFKYTSPLGFVLPVYALGCSPKDSKDCNNCKTTFVPYRHRQVYCKAQCREEDYKKKRDSKKKRGRGRPKKVVQIKQEEKKESFIFSAPRMGSDVWGYNPYAEEVEPKSYRETKIEVSDIEDIKEPAKDIAPNYDHLEMVVPKYNPKGRDIMEDMERLEKLEVENEAPAPAQKETSFTKSKRERLLYICVLLWLILGLIGVYNDVDLSNLAVYFTALSPFVIGYIYGETKRPSEKK